MCQMLCAPSVAFSDSFRMHARLRSEQPHSSAEAASTPPSTRTTTRTRGGVTMFGACFMCSSSFSMASCRGQRCAAELHGVSFKDPLPSAIHLCCDMQEARSGDKASVLRMKHHHLDHTATLCKSVALPTEVRRKSAALCRCAAPLSLHARCVNPGRRVVQLHQECAVFAAVRVVPSLLLTTRAAPLVALEYADAPDYDRIRAILLSGVRGADPRSPAFDWEVRVELAYTNRFIH
jgi:hypothetical protein